MKRLSIFAAFVACVAISTAAKADFFSTINKIGKVAETVNNTQKSLSEGRLEVPAPGSKGGGKRSGSSKKHK